MQLRRTLLWLALALPFSSLALAGWKTQTVELRPGWNAVYLEVSPEPGAVEAVFAGLPVRAVWRYKEDDSPVRYVDNANELKPDSGRWLTWLPASEAPGEVLKTLHAVHGGACYLIDLGGTTQVTWTVSGRPVLRNLSWLSASYSLVGLAVDPAVPVTFAQYFRLSPAHQGTEVRQLDSSGRWNLIPPTTPIRRGECYWVYSAAISSFQGPGCVKVDNRGLLDYGSAAVEQSLVLCNNTAAPAVFALQLDPAEAPTGESSSGSLQLSVWRDGSDGTNYGWEPLGGVWSLTVPANLEKTVRLAIRRHDMSGLGKAAGFYSLLKVSGPLLRQDLGLRASGFAAEAEGVGRYAGLWAGQCTLRAVSEARGENAGPALPTASEASLRLLVRVETNGAAYLLREAMILWLDGVSDAGTVTEPGRYLVAANAAELAQLETQYGAVGTGRLKGVAVRDDRSVPRRLSSVGFSMAGPVPMSGLFVPAAGQLTATVEVGYDDDLNPFKHRYHPDHDNLQAGTQTKLPEGKESYSFTRVITLDFAAVDPEELRLPGWGDTLGGGVYRETLSGLHRYPIKVEGTFRLTRVVGLSP